MIYSDSYPIQSLFVSCKIHLLKQTKSPGQGPRRSPRQRTGETPLANDAPSRICGSPMAWELGTVCFVTVGCLVDLSDNLMAIELPLNFEASGFKSWNGSTLRIGSLKLSIPRSWTAAEELCEVVNRQGIKGAPHGGAVVLADSASQHLSKGEKTSVFGAKTWHIFAQVRLNPPATS